MYEIDRGSGYPLTLDPGAGEMPVWSPKGDWIAYRNETGLYRIQPGPNPQPQLILASDGLELPSSWSPDGKELIFTRLEKHGREVAAVKVEGASGETRLLVQNAKDAYLGRVSPGGRWLAYATNVSGRAEVWIQAYPEAVAGQSLLVSSQGGTDPVWSRDGKTLFFLTNDFTAIMGVATDQDLSKWGLPEAVCELDPRFFVPADFVSTYDVAPDGRFVFVNSLSDRSPPEIRVVLNWFEELKRLVPVPETKK